jgi:predicted dehydrogenase
MIKMKRRQFIKSSAVFAGFSILPSGAWSDSPNSRFCTAHIGVGGMGAGDLSSVAKHQKVQVVGLADVDQRVLNAEKFKNMPDAAQFADYREMLSTMGDKIDGVVVSTPDHTHYPATLMAMNLGKPVYCQKPLTHEISEAYALAKLAKEKKIATQMGIQLHSSIGNRISVDFLQQGIIGKISKVYAWSSKKWGDDAPFNTGSDPVPDGLDWNLWLGTAKERPYLNGKYHRANWRKVLDFGCGTMGDMGVHILDVPYTALNLGFPSSVKVTCREPTNDSHPTKNIVEFVFPGTTYTADTVELTWFDGSYAPNAQAQTNPDLQLEDGKMLPSQGAMYIGEDGKRMLLPHMSAPQPLPRDLLGSITKPDFKGVNHYHEWVDAAMGQGTCSAGFDYASKLTAGVLLGSLGNRFPGQKLLWDGGGMRFTNNEDANKLVSRSYRTEY